MYEQVKTKTDRKNKIVVQKNSGLPRKLLNKKIINETSINKLGVAEASPLQLVQIFGGNNTLHGGYGDVHWHYVFLDTNTNTLHLTMSDHRSPNSRTWERRKTYTPTGRATGNWSHWVTRFGAPPRWAVDLVGAGDTYGAAAAYHADNKIRALLQARYPLAALNAADFPALPKLN